MSTVANSLNQLKEMGLLTDDDLSVCGRIAETEDVSVDSLIDILVDQGRLTKYQASVICNRKAGMLVIGDYVIQDKLGAGGMGVVYKAMDRRMHREVAIKMLLESGQQSDEKIERFRREAIAAARMNHPNIVTAYTANEHEGYPYLVMEYIKGRDLGSLVKKGDKLPVPEAVNYMLQTAIGMAYAHSRHIIHRDLKPSNLLLATPDDSDIRPGQYSRVKILDMGLARLTQPGGDVVSPVLAGSDLSATGMLMGTVDYMAPEQAMDTKRADHRSDIYSLGCTLYFLLTKRPVYTGNNLLERISAHLKADIPSLKEARPEVPEELNVVFQKMVAKKPRDRYQSMTEVVEALQAIDRQLSGFGSSSDVWHSGVPGESPEYAQPGSSYGSKSGSKSGSGSQGSAPTVASGSGPMGNVPGSSFGSTAYADDFPTGGTITQTGMPVSQKLIVVVLLGLMAGVMFAIYWKLIHQPKPDPETIVKKEKVLPPPPELKVPAYCQPVDGESKEVEVTVQGKKYLYYDVIQLDVSQLPNLPRNEFLTANANVLALTDDQGFEGKSAAERQEVLAANHERIVEVVLNQLLKELKTAQPNRAEELREANQQISQQLSIIAELLKIEKLEAAVKQQDQVLNQLKSMLTTIRDLPAVAEKTNGLTNGEMLVRFRLIPEDEHSKLRPFYMMENKVWSDLFRVFAKTHPYKMTEETEWSENPPGMQPAYHVNLQEAYWCARWMGGELPSAKEWDTAAGFYLPQDERGDYLGPYRQPNQDGDTLNVAIYGEPQAVDEPTDDISPFGIRHMAGNGYEFTRSHDDIEINEEFNPITPTTTVTERGWTYIQTPRLPLTYEKMLQIKNGPVGWGISNESSSEHSFRVVLEIPGK